MRCHSLCGLISPHLRQNLCPSGVFTRGLTFLPFANCRDWWYSAQQSRQWACSPSRVALFDANAARGLSCLHREQRFAQPSVSNSAPE